MGLSGKIVFSSGRAVDFDIWSIDLSSGQLKQLTTGDSWNDYPRWSPDGTKIAYLSASAGSLPTIFTMNADGSDKRQITKNIYCQYVSWSPDGKQLVFTSNAKSPTEVNLCLVNSDGSGEVKSLLSREGVETQPCWSPDGQTILFASCNKSVGSGPSDTDIMQLDLATGKATSLANHPAQDFSPCYSPDGKKIAFISCRNEQGPDFYSKQIAKIKAAVAKDDMRAVDAEIKALHALKQDSDIWVMNSDGSDPIMLTKNTGSENSLAWSPCGNFLVITQAPKGNSATERLAIIRSDNGAPVEFSYDRKPLETEVGADKVFNASWFQMVVPDFIERHFADAALYGEERHPDWVR